MNNKKTMYTSICLLGLFTLWTATLSITDVQTIGPMDSAVGFATINNFIHKFTGVNMSLYILTDWLSLIPLCFAVGFAVMGVAQWVMRKNLFKVDYSILILGVFYTTVIAIYCFFEVFIINYRPVLIDGCLEASYPSSTTVLVICIMLTAAMQLNTRIKNNIIRRGIIFAIIIFTVFMVAARFVSGVHWFSDIVGGILLSTGLVMMYNYLVNL